MPSVPTWEDTLEDTPTWEETVDESTDDLEMAAAFLGAEPAERIRPIPTGVSTIAGGPQLRTPGDLSLGPQVMEGIRGIPSAAGELTTKLVEPLIAPTGIEPHESVIGLAPERVSSGAVISEATGLPTALTVPVAAGTRALAGLGQFLTSPVGMADVGVAAIPGIGLLQRAKFVKDMAGGAGETAGRLSVLVDEAAKRQITTDEAQEMADETANALLMLYGAGKLTSHQVSQLTGIRAPLGRVLESKKTRLSKDLAEQLKRSAPLPVLPAPVPERRLGIPEAPLTAEPFLQPGVTELAAAALREAQGPRIEIPGELSALETLRREIEPPRIALEAPTRFAERIGGGGEAPYGKVSYQRPAEAPTTERTQQAIAEIATKPPVRETVQPEFNQLFYGDVSGKVTSKVPKSKFGDYGSATYVTPDESFARTFAEGTAFSSKPKGSGNVHRVSIVQPKNIFRSDSTRLTPEEIKFWEADGEDMRGVLTREDLIDNYGGRSVGQEDLRAISEAWDDFLTKFGYDAVWDGKQLAVRTGDVTIAPYGKVSYQRPAEAPITERTQRAIEAEKLETLPEPKPTTVSSPPETIVAASVTIRGKTATGANHAEAVLNYAKENNLNPADVWADTDAIESGFVTSKGRTITLEEANKLAQKTFSHADELKLDVISKLESLKLPETGEGRLYSLPHPDAIKAIGVSTWNSAIDVAILAVRAGKALAQAVDEAVKYLRRQGKQFDEKQIRSNLEYEIKGGEKDAVLQEGAQIPRNVLEPQVAQEGQVALPADASRPKTPKAQVTLEDVYKVFEPEPKKGPGLKQTLVKAVESFRTGFSSRFRPIDKLAEDIAKEYGIPSQKGIAGIFEQLKGSSGKAEADIYRFDKDVSSKVRGSEKDFSVYLFLRRSLDRLNQDVADVQAGKPVRRSVSTYTIPELEAKLVALESKLGPEKLKTFQETADLYQQHMETALRLQVESGRMSQEIYDSIKEGNAFYAPFKVLKYFEEGIKPEGTGRKIDTLSDFTKAMEGIESPDFKLGDMLGAARQNIALSRILAEKNNTMRRFAALADSDVNNVFTQRLTVPGQQAPRGMEVVNVLRNGKQERYAVNSDVAQAVQIFGNTANSFAARILQMASVPFRAGATALNIPFQISNILADVPRAALVSKYGIRGVTDLIRYPLDMIDAFLSSMLGNVTGYKNKLFLDFLDSGAAGTTIQEYLTPQGLKFQRTGIPQAIAKKALYALPDFSQAIEQTSKILGVKRAMRITGTESGKELAAKIPEAITEIRRFSGSPDFGRQGRWVEEARLNLLYMFLNARIQGVTADLGRLVGRDGAKEAGLMWGKMGVAIGVPTALLYALNRSSEYADDYDKRPKQEKENYWLIPKDTFITNEHGEKIRDYWRIPKRESAKWISNSLESAMDFAEKKDAVAFANWAETMIEEISPVNIQGETFQQRIESVGASLNPIIKAPMELATGRDMYRHRDIVPDRMQKASPSEQYTDRTAEVFKSLAAKMPDVLPEVFQSPIMLQSLVQNLTAGLVTQFLPKRPIEGRGDIENAALLQRFQALPYIEQEKFKAQMEILERNAADEQVRRYRTAQTFVREHRAMAFEDKLQLAARTFQGDLKQLERIIDVLIAEHNGVTSQERQVLALPVAQRAQYIASQLQGLNGDKKSEVLRNYATKRILTESVAVELEKLLVPE